MKLFVICHNIRSRENVGSIFRTADAFGVSKIFLTGFTPHPPHPKIAKTALGAEQCVSWETKKSAAALIKKLKNEGAHIIALEQAQKSIVPAEACLKFNKQPVALIVGNENKGVSLALLKHCDAIIEIPMRGALIRHKGHPKHKKIVGKESLNVATAFGIVAYVLSPYHS